MWLDVSASDPDEGQKVVLVCDDGCSSSLAMFIDGQYLDAEDAEPLTASFLDGAIWAALPIGYPIAFTEVTRDDWY